MSDETPMGIRIYDEFMKPLRKKKLKRFIIQVSSLFITMMTADDKICY